MYYRIGIIGRGTYQLDNPVWQLVDALRREGHAAVCIDPVKHPSVIQDGKINHGALAKFEERFRPDLVVRFKPGMTAESLLAQAREANAAGMQRPAKRFVIYGFVGKDNFGDELIFSVLCNRIQQRYPEAYYTLIGHGPRSTFLRHGVTSVTAFRKHEMDYMLNGAAALLFMAGIMFDDPFETQSSGLIDLFLNPGTAVSGQVGAVMQAWMHGVPSFGMGIGAGPLANPDAHRLLRLGALCRPLYFARDTETAQLLRAAGVPQDLVRQKADMAFTLDAPQPEEAKALLIGANLGLPQDYFLVSLREWKNATPEFFANVAKLIAHAAQQHGLTPVFVDFSPIDAPVHQAVAAQLPESVQPVFYGTAYENDQVLALFAQSRFSIAMRLHASILSAVMGHPCLALNYNNKVGALMEDMGLPQNLLAMGASCQEMTQALDAMMARYGEDAQRVQVYASACKAKALEAFQELFAAVDAAGVPPMDECIQYPRSVSAAQLKLQDARKELKAAEERSAQLEERAAQLEAQLAQSQVRVQELEEAAGQRGLGRLFGRRGN